jgi:hypothetical protein
MNPETLTTHQKALQINVDAKRYGTFAEIGGGQEVARWFFRVGGAAGTVAKTISAYDMAVSDAIYGPAERYVSRQRLQAMLDYEFNLLLERLNQQRGDRCTFFVFADTVATHSFSRKEDGQGWLGVRFQHAPHAAPSEIIIHVRLFEPDNWRQQEALGMLGVNLIHGAFHHHADPEALVEALMNELSAARVEINMIRFSGACFGKVDNRLMSLFLVQKGYSQAAVFTADGEVAQPSEVLYKRPILVERGSFRPVTLATLEILERAGDQMAAEPRLGGEPPVALMEMTLRSLLAEPQMARRDFLARADMLSALGKNVLISNFGPYHQLVHYLARYTQKPTVIALGIPSLQKLLEKESYAELEGGLLESLGRLFKNESRIYAYPWYDPQSGEVCTADTLTVAPRLQHLYRHLLENHFIQPVRQFTPEFLLISPAEVRARLQSGDPAWEGLVPPSVAEVIRREKLLGWKARS